MTIIGEFWTSRQRQASSIHEISYRACFKPQLPAYFIKRFSKEGDVIYDPFSGRGTTAIEAALLGRKPIANDINPLSTILTKPRIFIPDYQDIEHRLSSIPYFKVMADIDLSMFYHPDTEAEIVSLRNYLEERKYSGQEDELDQWIRMVATNRLTGHSSGFFSVYTLPPNQAASPQSQIKINNRLNQKPEYRDTKALILKKTKSLLKGVGHEDRVALRKASSSAVFLAKDAANTPEIPSETVQLTVTSPPFLDVVQYADDNWLRCWFNCIDTSSVAITMARSLDEWSSKMQEVFRELYRITKYGGYVAFEVGEVRNGKIKLDEVIEPLARNVGFSCIETLINSQRFTKTANIWGIENNRRGTNSNRIVLLHKP